ncbi:MAG: 2-hydroxyglutaryl-CoA dehydratase [Deltaproteobacteria bacterium HGW-Deltaproteobacteria-6]|jgi:predicted CoA-substrate-specific enzyme activase|nr:MAG: 2-hydroxyglutaryl-CoA dehydratase [Deltaproteobacteria bacterium HGW-Deltaproteobacteria-6]
MKTAGIDIGSITAKAAVVENGKIIGTKIVFTGYNAEAAGVRVYEELLAETGLDTSAIDKIVATGYGRNSVKFADKTFTEIMAHAAGAYSLNPKIRTIIDIGGQDSKAMALDEKGKVKNFVMNDKCAAGTGRFLEVMARALEVNLDEFGAMSLQSERPSKISSLCTVFAESEVISLIARGEKRPDIIAGIHESIAARVSAMLARVGVAEPVMITGGVARNKGVVDALTKKLGVTIEVSSYAQVNGAIGAAVLASSL